MATMTNQELADLIGCTHSMASRLRAGKRLPGMEAMERIHAELGVPWDELMTARSAGEERFGELMRKYVAKYVANRPAA